MTSLIVFAQGHCPALLLPFLADAPAVPDAAAPAGNPFGMLVLPLFLVGIYFLIFAPQMKRQKQQKKMIEALKTGDEVITTGGIFGIVTQVKPDRFVIEIAKGMRVEVLRANVEARVPDAAKDAESNKKA